MHALLKACQVAKEMAEAKLGRTIDGDGQTALAELIGKKQGHIGMWFKRGKVPAEDCPTIELKTEGRVTRAELRPDLFGEIEIKPSSKRRARA